MKRYRGKGWVSRHGPPEGENNCYLQVKMLPGDIHFFTNVMEAFEHVALIVPVAPREGVVALHYTPDMEREILAIIREFPRPLEIIFRE